VGVRRISAIVAAPLTAGSPATAADADRVNDGYFNRTGATLDAMLAKATTRRARAEGADSQINGIAVFTAGLADPATGEPVRDAAKKPKGAQLAFSMTRRVHCLRSPWRSGH
jgi:hypothetical protein